MPSKRRNSRKKRSDPRFVRPTAERETHNTFQSAGAAVRVVPPIASLYREDADSPLTREEFEALTYYRDQANLADCSPMRSCIDFSPKGGYGPGAAIMSAKGEVRRIEKGLGPYLARLLRAIVRDDVSLQQWCESHYGSAKPENIGMTIMELKYAAGGIVR